MGAPGACAAPGPDVVGPVQPARRTLPVTPRPRAGARSVVAPSGARDVALPAREGSPHST